MIVEAFLPNGISPSTMKLELDSFIHGFRQGSPLPVNDGNKLCNSASCQVDISCSQGADWQVRMMCASHVY